MTQEKRSGGENRAGKEIDFDSVANQLCADNARARNAGSADVLTDLAESLDLLANVAVFYIRQKGIRDGDFTEDQFFEEFGE